MTVHRSDQTRIMRLFPFDSRPPDNLPPTSEDASLVEEKREDEQLIFHGPIGSANGEPKAIPLQGSGRNHPKLIQNLRNQDAFVACFDQSLYGSDCQLVSSIIRVRETNENIRVEQNPHSPRPS
jgi:hypothetical protein